eukprot:1568730-Alexandrium_andersonii.AAC.1
MPANAPDQTVLQPQDGCGDGAVWVSCWLLRLLIALPGPGTAISFVVMCAHVVAVAFHVTCVVAAAVAAALHGRCNLQGGLEH